MPRNYTAHPIDHQTFAIEEKTKFNQGLCYLLCGSERALLIDTGLGYEDLPDTIRTLTTLPVVVANTHAHVDHIGGNHFFEEIWFHEKDRNIFALHTNPDYTFRLLTEGTPRLLHPIMKLLTRKMLNTNPNGNYHYFDDHKVFHLGGRDVEVIPTPGHTPGSVCFLDQKARQLFSGDSLCHWGILLHFEGECCPPATYLASLERLLAQENDFDTIWPGHHGFPVDKDYLAEYHTCATQIVQGTATYKLEKGRRCATFGRILISVPKEL